MWATSLSTKRSNMKPWTIQKTAITKIRSVVCLRKVQSFLVLKIVVQQIVLTLRYIIYIKHIDLWTNFTLLEMLEKLFTRKALLVSFLAHVTTSPLSSDSSVSVTVGIMDRYHSTCVYLLSPQLPQGKCQDALPDSWHHCSMRIYRAEVLLVYWIYAWLTQYGLKV